MMTSKRRWRVAGMAMALSWLTFSPRNLYWKQLIPDKSSIISKSGEITWQRRKNQSSNHAIAGRTSQRLPYTLIYRSLGSKKCRRTLHCWSRSELMTLLGSYLLKLRFFLMGSNWRSAALASILICIWRWSRSRILISRLLRCLNSRRISFGRSVPV